MTQVTREEAIAALLAVQLGIKAALYALENGDVDIEQVDRDTCEDGRTQVATAHLSDGSAIVASVDPESIDETV